MHRILILDDDTLSARLLAGYVTDLQHAVRRTTQTAEAWNLIRTWIPDIVIFDGDPNGLSGCDLVEQVRKDALFASLPFVVCAGVTRREVVDRYIQLRIQGIMVKPFDGRRVAMEIERANRRPFRASFFLPLQDVMSQSMLEAVEVARMYRQVAEEIRHVLGHVGILRNEPFNPQALTWLFGIKGCGSQVGCPVLFQMIDEAVRAYNRLDARPIRRTVESLPVFVRLLRRQADDIDELHGPTIPSVHEDDLDSELNLGVSVDGEVSPETIGPASSDGSMTEEEAEFVRMVREAGRPPVRTEASS